jgi:hypothetical protein
MNGTDQCAYHAQLRQKRSKCSLLGAGQQGVAVVHCIIRVTIMQLHMAITKQFHHQGDFVSFHPLNDVS